MALSGVVGEGELSTEHSMNKGKGKELAQSVPGTACCLVLLNQRKILGLQREKPGKVRLIPQRTLNATLKRLELIL